MFALLITLSACFSEWRTFAHTTPLRDSDREAILADAYGFGADYEAAKSLRIDAHRHRCDVDWRAQVFVWNGRDACWRWDAETEWRYRCWDALEDALNAKMCLYNRLIRLNVLRDLIGDEAYRARRMPAPTPSYRMSSLP